MLLVLNSIQVMIGLISMHKVQTEPFVRKAGDFSMEKKNQEEQ